MNCPKVWILLFRFYQCCVSSEGVDVKDECYNITERCRRSGVGVYSTVVVGPRLNKCLTKARGRGSR